MDAEDQSELLTLQLEVENVDQRLESIGQQINKLLSKQERLNSEKMKLLAKIDELEKQGTQPIEKLDDWNSDAFEWSVELKETLMKYFSISDFRPLQKETMNVTLSGRNCILIMPTGGGKSLSFQLPALISTGFTLVISPLISLMEDQLIALRRLNINAMMLSSSTSTALNSQVLAHMISPKCEMKILYVTPERLAKSKRFMAKLEKAYSIGNISRIVIDEVHCASTWGHDFRPDYKILGILKRQFPKVPLLGLTATASEKVLADVKDILNLDRRCVVFRASFNRPNLFYEVYKTCLEQKKLVAEISLRIKSQFKGMSGIIYCFSRKDSEEVGKKLVEHGIKAHCYHADLPSELKSSVHEAWIAGELQVVVATVAFGMGIDKPNVRFVIHFSISKSMENYYQESGRAGRDDKPSWCILYFRFQDISRQCAMVFTEKTGLPNLHQMVRYCIDRRKCRRIQIGKHFAENWEASQCNQMCDNCKRVSDYDGMSEISLSKDATTLVNILQDAASRDERLTPIKLIDIWLGKGKVSTRPKEICCRPRDDCEDIVTKLLIEQILQEDFHFTAYSTITYVIPGPRWPLLKSGNISVKFDMISKKRVVIAKNGSSKAVSQSKEIIATKAKKRKTFIIESDSEEEK